MARFLGGNFFSLHFDISESRKCLTINVSFTHIVLCFLFLKKATTELMMYLTIAGVFGLMEYSDVCEGC